MSSSITDIIKSRRTIHQFKADQVPPLEQIHAAIEHAVWAPNHHLTEPWRFHLLGENSKEKLCQLNAELVREKTGDSAAEAKLKRWREMPGWLVLSCLRSDDPLREREDYAACCCAAQNMMLYLWEQGIGVKWSTGDVIRHPAFYEATGIDPATLFAVGLFWYGYSDRTAPARRKPLDDVLVELP